MAVETPAKPEGLDELVAARFAAATADHRMRILRDDVPYRHLRFAQPGTAIYSFDLITWPDHLAISGDIASGYVFGRARTDMIDFFASGPGVNPDYWAEKLCNEGARSGARGFDAGRLYEQVEDTFSELGELGYSDSELAAIRAAWQECIEAAEPQSEDDAARPLSDFGPVARFRFHDTWEWDLTSWNADFLYACNAVRFGARRYLRSKGSSRG